MKYRVMLIFMMGCLSVSAQDRQFTLPEVVVTGTGTQHLLKDVPVQTEVISRKVLESYGGKSLEEILGGLTASFAFNESDMGSQMQMNGLGNNYILILVDGKRIHGDNGGENDLGLIDPHNVERIEIVKGAQSALYGSDAIAGVVNIITRKHQESGIYLENTTRYGSHNDLRQHNGIALKYGKWGSYTNFQMQHTDGWQNTGDEYTEGMLVHDSKNRTVNKYTNWQVSERLTYDFSKDLSLYAEGWVYGKMINRPKDGNYASCDVYTYDLKYKNASASAGAKWKVNPTDYVTVDVDWNKHAYFYKYTATTLEDGYDPNGKFTNYFPYFAGQQKLQSDQQRTLATVKGVFYLPAQHILNVGGEFRYDYLEAPTRVIDGKASDWTASVYAQDEFNLLNWLNITVGLRLNQNGAFGFKATPKVSTMLSLGDFRLRMGWSQGFKTPTPKELRYRYLRRMGSKDYFYMGNEDLKAQTNNYWSLGAEYRNEKFTLSLTGYLNQLENMITLVNVPVSEIPVGSTEFLGDGSSEIIPRKYKNMEDAKTYGLDMNTSYHFNAEWSVGGNYSYLNTDAHVYNEKHNRLDAVTIDGMAHHKWNAYLTWNHRFSTGYKLNAGLYTRGSSKRFYQTDGDGKHFQIWRVATTHDFSRKGKDAAYRLELGVDNLFNYIDKTPRHHHLGTTTPGTTLYATFSIKYNTGKKIKHITTKKDNYDED